MKYAILGDIPGNLEALEAVLAACRELGVEKYACIGDIVGSGFYNEQVAQANGAPFDQPTQYELVDCATDMSEEKPAA